MYELRYYIRHFKKLQIGSKLLATRLLESQIVNIIIGLESYLIFSEFEIA